MLNDIRNEIINGNIDLKDIENGKDILFEEEDSKFIFTTLNNQKQNIENHNISNIFLGKCETRLRNAYNLSENSNLFILKFEKELKGMKIPKIEYEIYVKINNNSTKQLNLSVCEQLRIDIYIPINETIDKPDKFNIKSGYYQDICYTSSENGIDISILDRKNEFIKKNMTLCEENCDFERYDNNLGKVICSCLTKIKIPIISEISFDNNKLLNKFKDVKAISNINVLKCHFLLFNKNGIIKNIGFFALCPIIIFNFFLIFIVNYKEFKKIDENIGKIVDAKKYIYNNRNKKIDQSDKKIKKKNINRNLKHDSNKIKMNKSIKIKSNSKTKSKSHIQNKDYSSTNKFQKRNLNNNITQILRSRISTNLNFNKKSNSNSIINSENKYLKILEYNPNELNLLEYKNALSFDKRSFCQYYINLVSNKNIFLFAFFVKNDYNSRIMKINLFFNMFAIHFGVNALFFSDSTMHQIYEDKGTFNFIYQIPKILYSLLISLILNSLLKFLCLTEKDILKVKNINIKDIDKASNTMKFIKIKFTFFILVSFIIILFLWYYLLCFCAVYENTQIHLLKNSLISFGSSFFTPFFIYIFPGMLRIPSLQSKKKECLYKLSKIIQWF